MIIQFLRHPVHSSTIDVSGHAVNGVWGDIVMLLGIGVSKAQIVTLQRRHYPRCCAC